LAIVYHGLKVDVPARFILDQDLVGRQFSHCVMYRFEDGVIVPEDLFGEPVSDNVSITH
jgi:hypothetical protein